MILLSVDLGDSRTGIAVCDKLEILASPVTVIHEKYIPLVLQRVTQLATEYKAEAIIVGYPKNMNASIGSRAQKCSDFAASLQEMSGLPTVLWDERLTTVSAHAALNETKTFGKKRKAIIDSVAAVMILQSYLDYRRTHHEETV